METVSFTLNNYLEVVSLPARDTVRQALVLLHGRGGSALNILQITREISIPDTCLVIAPEAPNHTWYPYRFIEPQEANEPDLSQALAIVADICAYLYTEYSLKPEQITLGGFSQGACLVAEFLKRSPEHYHAAAIWSGGLIGTDEEAATDLNISLTKIPVYLGCDEKDFHIPKERVLQTAQYFTEHNAKVDLELYQDLGHAIHPNGLHFIEKNLS